MSAQLLPMPRTAPDFAGLLAGAALAETPQDNQRSIRVGLPHMNMILSITAEPANGAETMEMAATADPFAERLAETLDAFGQDLGVLREDMIRLAIAARWLRRPTPPRPVEPAPEQVSALPKWRLRRVLDYVETKISEGLSLADLAAAAGLSRMYFAAQFRAATGCRPHEFVLRRRIARAQELLTGSELPLVEVALSVGFQTQAHFTTVFKKMTGETPRRWRDLRRDAA